MFLFFCLFSFLFFFLKLNFIITFFSFTPGCFYIKIYRSHTLKFFFGNMFQICLIQSCSIVAKYHLSFFQIHMVYDLRATLVDTIYKGKIFLTNTTTKTLICPGWETAVVPVSQPGTRVRDKRGALLSRVWQPGQKVQPAPTWLAHPFVPVGVTNRDKKSLFSCFTFLNSFSISIILLHFN